MNLQLNIDLFTDIFIIFIFIILTTTINSRTVCYMDPLVESTILDVCLVFAFHLLIVGVWRRCDYAFNPVIITDDDDDDDTDGRVLDDFSGLGDVTSHGHFTTGHHH